MIRKKKSAKRAAERLQVILYHDRANISPATLEILRAELVEVIVKHVDVDPSMVSIELARDGRNQSLIADIPLKSRNY